MRRLHVASVNWQCKQECNSKIPRMGASTLALTSRNSRAGGGGGGKIMLQPKKTDNLLHATKICFKTNAIAFRYKSPRLTAIIANCLLPQKILLGISQTKIHLSLEKYHQPRLKWKSPCATFYSQKSHGNPHPPPRHSEVLNHWILNNHWLHACGPNLVRLFG